VARFTPHRPEDFELPTNCEDSSNFEDFWTEWIATKDLSFRKIFRVVDVATSPGWPIRHRGHCRRHRYYRRRSFAVVAKGVASEKESKHRFECNAPEWPQVWQKTK